jgi:hypothetical protein
MRTMMATTTTMATVRSMATMATGDDDDDGDDDDGATTDDVGDGGMGAATGYDDDDAFDGCGIFQWRRRRTKARWRGQREMQQSNHKMRWYHVLRGEVHKKYLRQIVG